MKTQIVRFYKELIAEKGFFELKATGNSMAPFIRDGQTLIITKDNNLLPGNCYLFRDNDQLVLHRLAGKLKNKKLLFIGDNSSKIEEVTEENVIGQFCEKLNNFTQLLITIVNLAFIHIYKTSPRIGSKLFFARKTILNSIIRSKNEKRVCQT